MARINPLMILPPLIFALLAGVFAFGMMREDPDSLPSAMIGRDAPGVAASVLAEKPAFSDETLRDGQVKLVNFWASWCAPCRVEHPNLQALADEGIPIYGVNYKDRAADALGFLEELGDPYTGLITDEGRMALNWGVYGVPETYVIDGNGTVLARVAGPVTQRTLESTIRPALEKAAGG